MKLSLPRKLRYTSYWYFYLIELVILNFVIFISDSLSATEENPYVQSFMQIKEIPIYVSNIGSEIFNFEVSMTNLVSYSIAANKHFWMHPILDFWFDEKKLRRIGMNWNCENWIHVNSPEWTSDHLCILTHSNKSVSLKNFAEFGRITYLMNEILTSEFMWIYILLQFVFVVKWDSSGFQFFFSIFLIFISNLIFHHGSRSLPVENTALVVLVLRAKILTTATTAQYTRVCICNAFSSRFKCIGETLSFRCPISVCKLFVMYAHLWQSMPICWQRLP